MKKIYIVSLFILLTFSAIADESKIYLLTSINAPKALLRTKGYFNKDVEKVFRIAFKNSGYKTVIKHKVDQVELHKILLDYTTIGVFWISHSNHFMNYAGPLAMSSIVADHNGLNAKQIFQQLNPNLKFLGFVGCRAKSMFDHYSKTIFKTTNPNLKIYSSDKKITPKKGLIAAINASVDYLGNGNPRQKHFIISHINASNKQIYSDVPVCSNQEYFKLKVRRTITANTKVLAVKFLINRKNRLIGTLPEIENNTNRDILQETNLLLPIKEYSTKSTLNIHVESMQEIVAQSPNYGAFNFGENDNWKLFAGPSGKAIGKVSNLYIYKGEVPHNLESTVLNFYKCQ